jgi:hypothetical protein
MPRLDLLRTGLALRSARTYAIKDFHKGSPNPETVT